MRKDYQITSCGLNCEVCDFKTSKIEDAAVYIYRVFEDPVFAGLLSLTNPKFKQENLPIFQEILAILKSYPPCPGCQDRSTCPINHCTKEKGISNCSECNFFNIEQGTCTASPVPSENPMMPPAPIFFNYLDKRYRGWNVKHLKALKEGKIAEINTELEKMKKEGKSSRDMIDLSVNLFKTSSK